MTPLDSAHATAETLLAPGEDDGLATAKTAAADPTTLLSSLPPPTATARTTVLPRIEGEGASVRLVAETKSRYEPVQMLGSGGMGEVLLVHDQDIARKVAVKRLLPEASDPVMLARFVDEIRCVGRLEHPNIVPIHDVGVDELGRYFFVMKYVEGETLETIIHELSRGNPDYLRKYTFERRVEIFMDVLQALSYAHAHGVVHRDVKPANVMVGRYGEVVLMDWGIAKPVAARRDLARGGPDAMLGEESERGRMFMTHVGALVGTPAYMSPEQARGDVDTLDAKSDLYSASVMFHELLTLRHYLAHRGTTSEVIEGVLSDNLSVEELEKANPVQGAHPAELGYFVIRGLEKDPEKRYVSAGHMIDLLQEILEGKIHVSCSGTLTKRMLREMARGVDKSPRVAFWSFLFAAAAIVFTVVQIVRMVVSYST